MCGVCVVHIHCAVWEVGGVLCVCAWATCITYVCSVCGSIKLSCVLHTLLHIVRNGGSSRPCLAPRDVLQAAFESIWRVEHDCAPGWTYK